MCMLAGFKTSRRPEIPGKPEINAFGKRMTLLSRAKAISPKDSLVLRVPVKDSVKSSKYSSRE